MISKPMQAKGIEERKERIMRGIGNWGLGKERMGKEISGNLPMRCSRKNIRIVDRV
jgi:hypothetical protein